MNTRKEIWDRKQECEFALQHFFSAVQNPIELTYEDIEYMQHSYQDFLRNIQLAKEEMMRYIGSDEYFAEIKEYQEEYGY